MAVTSINSSATAQNLQTAQSQAQLGMLKKANDLQAEQVQQLLQAQAQNSAQVERQMQAQQAAAVSGQPGGVINTYA